MGTQEHMKRCLRCNSVSVRPRKGVGRTRPYRVLATLPIPDAFEIPTCRRCGAEFSDASMDRALDQMLAAVYLDSLQTLAKESIRKLTERDAATKRRFISQRQLELVLGLSQGYLSRLLSGHGKPSTPLVLLLGLLSLSPKQTLREVQRFWALSGLPNSTAELAQEESVG